MKNNLFRRILVVAAVLLFVGGIVRAQEVSPVETEDVISVQTAMLNVALTPVPTKNKIVWTVKRNGIEEKDFVLGENKDKIDLTVIVEDVRHKRNQQSFFVSQNLKRLAKHPSLSNVNVLAIGKEDAAFRWSKNWRTSFVESFDQAVEAFWNAPTPNKRALLIISNRTDELPADIFDRLKNQTGLQTALVYYLSLKPIKKRDKWYASWCNLNWLNMWQVTFNEQYVDKQFDFFNEMLASYRILGVYLGDEPRVEINIVGIEEATGKKLVDQTRVYEKGE